MAVLPILTAPDPRLKRRAAPVRTADARVRRLLDDMLETMYAARGIGLAGPQVGVAERLAVADLDAAGGDSGPLRMIDPRVVAASDDDAVFEEGCLSLPSHHAEVARPRRARIAWRDETGARREMEAEGLLAACVQHEIDHLDGILFVDRISRVRRSMILRKLAKAKREGAGRAAA